MQTWVLSAILGVATVLTDSATAGGLTWYVSTSGDDANPGTRSRPFASLGRAVMASRTAPQGEARRILIGEGLYFAVSVELNPEDSGLTIAAEPGSKPVLCGGLELSSFVPDGDKLWAADLPAGASADFRLLVVNNRMADRARLPASGRLSHLTRFNQTWNGTFGGGWKPKPSHEQLTTMTVRPEDLGSAFEPTNAELTIYHEWDESLVGVESYDQGTGQIRFTTESGHPPGAFGNRTYVVWNTREGMTRPGQWYVDRKRRKVVYWPLESEEPAKLRAVFPVTERVITVRGNAAKPVRSLMLEGLTLEVANTPLEAGGFGAYSFDGVLTADWVENCRFRDLEVKNAAGQGIKVNHAVRCELASNTLYDLGAGGILTEGRSLAISRNEIHHIGRLYPSGIGLTCGGKDNHVYENYIHEVPYVGLTSTGLRALIESNRLERVMQELHDGAGIYLGGSNHLIRANCCLQIGESPADRRHAYYMDEHVRYSRLERNLAIDCPSPLHNHMATNNAIVNNVFINHGDLRLSFFRCADHRLERNLVWATGKIEVFRPEAVSVWTNNLFFSQSATVLGYPVENYSPGTAFRLSPVGMFTGPDPELTIRPNGCVTWPKSSIAHRLGILPVDACEAGR
jgi:hypothetical protein